MKFNWLKHGDHRDDYKAISQDDDQYCMTETVIVNEYKNAVLFFHLYHDTVHTSFCMFLPNLWVKTQQYNNYYVQTAVLYWCITIVNL